ncbi:MAG TPA: peptidylprolyl isomerase [Chitinophagaceae bacterium]|nr:peptidylprolyl isomerase [Chitinophagaceae bacterium]
MSKKLLIAILACFLILHASAQTLFTYGKYSVDAKDFLRAYTKNNTQPVVNKAKAINDYLDLYIKSRLKIQEAYERRYDTLPQIKTEVENLRTQIAENYMTDPDMASRLTKEAFRRSLKDIHVAHIFISFRNATGSVDTMAAQKKRDDIWKQLQKGDDFLKIAEQNSDDPSVKNNKGDLGYITVMTLPYEFENAIYATPVGKYSSVVRSKIGYHIFKNLGERKAVGKIKAQQILLAIPPGATDAEKKQIAGRADSLYKKIIAGENFNRLASSFSNDYISAAAGGIMPDISVGQYDPVFENVLWSLTKDNAVSKPFLTPHGWHIVKRLSLKPVITDPNDKSNMQDLQQRITNDNRWKSSRDFIYNQVISKAGYKKFPYDDAALWNMSDSVLDLKPMLPIGRTIIATTPMFSIGDSVYNATAWVNYANVYRFKQDGTGAKPHEQVREEWVKFAMINYYKVHLEDFNEEFRNQMQEFRDGNLFFEIMQQEIWNKAQGDSAALQALYEKNKNNYLWKQSAEAVVFFCSDESIAKTAYAEIKKDPGSWRKVAEKYTEKIVVDSSRYEWSQLPNLNNVTPRAGMITTPLLNKIDNTASFAYILKVYPQPTQRSFNEAKGLVINDYQASLEREWNEALRKKFPVVIDQKVLAEISK